MLKWGILPSGMKRMTYLVFWPLCLNDCKQYHGRICHHRICVTLGIMYFGLKSLGILDLLCGIPDSFSLCLLYLLYLDIWWLGWVLVHSEKWTALVPDNITGKVDLGELQSFLQANLSNNFRRTGCSFRTGFYSVKIYSAWTLRRNNALMSQAGASRDGTLHGGKGA